MNKKVLGIAVALLLAAMFLAPVMAAPATKIEGVTATIDITVSAGDKHLVDHNIMQLREGTGTGTVTLTIPGFGTLEGTYSGEWMGTVKRSIPPPGPDPEAEGILMGKPVLTFTGEGTTGTFEGVRHTKTIGMPDPVQSYINSNMVLQGTGDFEGQTLKLSYEGAPPAVFEGYLIIP